MNTSLASLATLIFDLIHLDQLLKRMYIAGFDFGDPIIMNTFTGQLSLQKNQTSV